MLELRDALRLLRSEAGLTQTELAAAVNVSFSTVNRWENQGKRPNFAASKALAALARQHHVSASCLDSLNQHLFAARADAKEFRMPEDGTGTPVNTERRDLLVSEQLTAAIDCLDIGIVGQRFFSLSPKDCDIFYFNRSFAALLGYSAEEFSALLSRDAFFAVAPESLRHFLRQLQNVLTRQIRLSDFSSIIQMQRKDSTSIWVEVNAVTLQSYSYGQELFTSCRDVSNQVLNEQKNAEAALIRDASLQNVFFFMHFDVTDNAVLHQHNLPALIGCAYAGESADELLSELNDTIPDSKEKPAFQEKLDCAALLAAYIRNDISGSITFYSCFAHRWIRGCYSLLTNSYTGHIEALFHFYDVQNETLSAKMMRIVSDKFFDYIGVLDVESEMIKTYYCSERCRLQPMATKRHYPTVCDAKLRLSGCADQFSADLAAISLDCVRSHLKTAKFYAPVLHLRNGSGGTWLKKISYTYLDDTQKTIIVAQMDLENPMWNFEYIKEHMED